MLNFGCQQVWVEEWGVVVRQTSVQKSSPNPQPVGKSFYRLREGATCRNSTVSSDRPVLKLVTGSLTSIILVVLGLVPFP